MAETKRTATADVLSRLRLLPGDGRSDAVLPKWRVTLAEQVALCDMQPPLPLGERIDVLRLWSTLLAAPITYDKKWANRVYAGLFLVRVVRDGADARVRAFITHEEVAVVRSDFPDVAHAMDCEVNHG